MVPLPWTRFWSRSCPACGNIYRDYTPILTIVEEIKLSSLFGGIVEPCIRGYIIEKGS